MERIQDYSLVQKGDKHQPENYRPITLLLILYKLFSRMVHARIKTILEAAQPVDQAGFRAGFSCTDHLFTISQIAEKMNELRMPLWVCAVDFKKAFDTVEHTAIWAALKEQQVPARYVDLLRSLYAGQVGQAITDKESRKFTISRGTKQGDPISPSLFSAVLQHALVGTVQSWVGRNLGLCLGSSASDILTNLRFADDILLMAKSRNEVEVMLRDLKSAAAKVGLELHMGKTKILANKHARDSVDTEEIIVAGENLDILGADEVTMYLGRHLTLNRTHATEFDARLASAWRKFMMQKSELCTNRYPLRERLRLFEATVTRSALYGCETWTMTASDKKRLRTTQRRMLRWMIGSRRKVVVRETEGGEQEDCERGSDSDDLCSEGPHSEPRSARGAVEEGEVGEDGAGMEEVEDFATWTRRATEMAESELSKAHLEDWVNQQRRQAWKWAGHVTRMTDNRWTVRALCWSPPGTRAVGRPRKRWTDDIEDFMYSKASGLDEKRLRFMWRHCGESKPGTDGKYCTNRWREWWAKLEDEFVANI